MFKFRLTEEFKRRADDSPPYPRGAVSPAHSVGSMFDNTKLGAYAALGAIALGAVMMVANIQRNRCEDPVAAVPVVAPATPEAAALAVAPKPASTPVALAPAAPAVAAPDKMTARVDTSTTGAIAQDTPAKPKHKHVKKPKPVDNPG